MATKKTNGHDHAPAAKAATRTTKPRTTATRSTAGAKAAGLQEHAAREPSRDEIAHRAYQLFEQRGHQHGHHMDDWYRAEAELRVRARQN